MMIDTKLKQDLQNEIIPKEKLLENKYILLSIFTIILAVFEYFGVL